MDWYSQESVMTEMYFDACTTIVKRKKSVCNRK